MPRLNRGECPINSNEADVDGSLTVAVCVAAAVGVEETSCIVTGVVVADRITGGIVADSGLAVHEAIHILNARMIKLRAFMGAISIEQTPLEFNALDSNDFKRKSAVPIPDFSRAKRECRVSLH